MAELITPKDFVTWAPPRLMGTEAEDHVRFLKDKYYSDEIIDDDGAVNKILSSDNFAQANITAVQYPGNDDSDKWLGNGQRMYEDCGLLESCTAEQLGPKKTLAGIKAGISVLGRLVDASRLPVQIFRRSATVDDNGNVAKSGFHMNHIAPQAVSHEDTLSALDVHAATRLYTWEGMVAPQGFTLSQKAHGYSKPWHFYKGQDSVDNGFMRIEDYSGEDSSPWGTFMAMATSSVLLRVLEHPEQRDLNKRLKSLRLESPRQAIQIVSSDTKMRESLQFADGLRKNKTAIEIQTELADIAFEFGKRFKLPEDEQYAVDQWQEVCRDLKEAAKTGEIRPLATRIGWVSKKLWLERKHTIGPLKADNKKAVHADMDWDSLYPKQGGRLQFPERTGLTIVSEADVAPLIDNPPQDNRAAIRGGYIQEGSFEFYGIHWDSMHGEHLDTGNYREVLMHPYQTEEYY